MEPDKSASGKTLTATGMKTPLALKYPSWPQFSQSRRAPESVVFRQPGDRDVVEDVIAREALGLSLKDGCGQIVAACVVIKEIGHQADRRVNDSVPCLRPQTHSGPIRDCLLIYDLATIVSDLLII